MAITDHQDIIARALEAALRAGASSAEANLGTGTGFSVTARGGAVETLEHQRDKGLGITVYLGQRKGSANTSDFSATALEETAAAAVAIAKNSGEDDCAGLIDPHYLATDVPDLDLCHPWDISPEQAIEMMIRCERIAREQDPAISNSEGASLHTYSGYHGYGNSNGFIGGWDWSTHSIDCSVIAGTGSAMQRDGWYSRSRDYRHLDEIETIAKTAATRALRRLGARKLGTRQCPVIYEAEVAGGLFSSFINAISGSAQYRRSTFLLDQVGKPVFPAFMNIHERPHLPGAIGSAPFDADGMATTDRTLIDQGVLQGYVLSAYSARKLKLPPTGNAGGIHNLVIEPGDEDLQALMNRMGSGLLISELIGFGVNQVTGDYSRGASGFWVEDGQIVYPVEEITVAGNLMQMYQQIQAIGKDVDMRGNIRTGSVLIDGMTIAGE